MAEHGSARPGEVPGARGGQQPTTAVPPAVAVADVTCSCDTPHDGAPENVIGCGASFRLELEAEPEATS
ncbi:hypothetical protein [Streptomyces sp. NBC_01443]|uniref:hypothetical protein n=1 Tax=Streptomyces sp. NBC_01443 TaxID=2903868 RepID=UPI00225B05B7|nr:hypothetical protein [Streptomyces sp. NBC_01443]MCX4632283.1 hypothetical protein [Streptomyces sp. NBC_01443]